MPCYDVLKTENGEIGIFYNNVELSEGVDSLNKVALKNKQLLERLQKLNFSKADWNYLAKRNSSVDFLENGNINIFYSTYIDEVKIQKVLFYDLSPSEVRARLKFERKPRSKKAQAMRDCFQKLKRKHAPPPLFTSKLYPGTRAFVGPNGNKGVFPISPTGSRDGDIRAILQTLSYADPDFKDLSLEEFKTNINGLGYVFHHLWIEDGLDGMTWVGIQMVHHSAHSGKGKAHFGGAAIYRCLFGHGYSSKPNKIVFQLKTKSLKGGASFVKSDSEWMGDTNPATSSELDKLGISENLTEIREFLMTKNGGFSSRDTLLVEAGENFAISRFFSSTQIDELNRNLLNADAVFPPNLLPFGYSYFGDLYCLDKADGTVSLKYWDNEVAVSLASSFDEFFNALVVEPNPSSPIV